MFLSWEMQQYDINFSRGLSRALSNNAGLKASRGMLRSGCKPGCSSPYHYNIETLNFKRALMWIHGKIIYFFTYSFMRMKLGIASRQD